MTERTQVMEDLTDAFINHHGVKVHMKDGDTIELAPRSLNVFGSPDSFTGQTAQGLDRRIRLADVERVESLSD